MTYSAGELNRLVVLAREEERKAIGQFFKDYNTLTSDTFYAKYPHYAGHAGNVLNIAADTLLDAGDVTGGKA